MICGGADPISRISVNGFNCLKSLSPSAKASSFSQERDGLIIGEGAAIFVLEDLDSAKQRGATILAEVLGYGLANDAYHMTSPDPQGGGAIRAMKNCLKDANLETTDVQYINAHGTGTQFNDAMETKALLTFFGEHAVNIPVSSIKGMVGHTLGAAGSVEFAATTLCITDKFLPPTINFGTPIEGFEKYDFVPNKSREVSINYAISNSYAFAGNTASIAVGRYLEE
jgi:3-oxoacyl-[acyl-carrier-protein] synthase II